MAKSKKRFSKPKTWTPVSQATMQVKEDGLWVSISDYRELESAYKGALCQLERAGRRIHSYRLQVPNK